MAEEGVMTDDDLARRERREPTSIPMVMCALCRPHLRVAKLVEDVSLGFHNCIEGNRRVSGE